MTTTQGVGPFNQSPQDRFQFVSQPPAAPGVCFTCQGIPNEERSFFVDTGIQLDFYGAVYICNLCLYDMAHTAEFITPVEAYRLKFKVESLENEKYHLQRELTSLQELGAAVDRFVSDRDSRRSVVGGVFDSVPPPSLFDAEPGDTGADSGGTTSAFGGASEFRPPTGTSDESGDDSNLAGLRPNEPTPRKFTLGI